MPAALAGPKLDAFLTYLNGLFSAEMVRRHKDLYLEKLGDDDLALGGLVQALVGDALGALAAASDVAGSAAVFHAYLDGLGEEATRTLRAALSDAVGEGRAVAFGWVPAETVQVVVPQAWALDLPLPVVVCAPHPPSSPG